MLDDQTGKYTININDQLYYFKLTLYNGVQVVEVPYSFVEALQFRENLYNWYMDGSLLLKNDLEFFERGTVTSLSSNTRTSASKSSIYTFRTDGRNKINLKFYPISLLETPDNKNANLATWGIDLDLVVTEIEDITSARDHKKFKKLSFVDERLQIFSEINTPWSTYYLASQALSSAETLPIATQSNYTESKIKAGAAIKHLIQTACKSPDIEGTVASSLMPYEIKVGFDDSGSIDRPNINVASFQDTWDDGSDDSYIFYTSPATYSVFDDIEYMSSHYLASTSTSILNTTGGYDTSNMPGILSLHRFTKKWNIFGIDTLFNDLNKTSKERGYKIESFTIQMPTINNEKPSINISNVKDITELHIPNTSVIYAYNVLPMSNQDDINITNRPVIHYDREASTWSVHTKQNSIEAVHSVFEEKFIKKLPVNSLQKGLLSLNLNKLKGINTYPHYSVAQTTAATIATRNEMLFKSLLLNQSISFTAKGLTNRSAGRFVNIITSFSTLTDFEKKFVGQWMLTDVVHVLKQDTGYTNECIAVKISSYQDTVVTDDINRKDKIKV